MTEAEFAPVVAYCDDNKISYKQRLPELGINPWNFYDAKRKYAPTERGEDAGISNQINKSSSIGSLPLTGCLPIVRKIVLYLHCVIFRNPLRKM